MPYDLIKEMLIAVGAICALAVETGSWPGAVWLWFYTLLYQIPTFVNSDSADLWLVAVVAIVTLMLLELLIAAPLTYS